MKIAIDLTSLADNFSGIERMTLSITKELLAGDRENRYQLFFKESVYPDFIEYETDPRVELIVLPRKTKLWFAQVTLWRALNKSDADIFLFLAFPSPYFLRKKGIINTIHDMGCRDCPETMKNYMALYFQIMFRNSARVSEKIITISEFSKSRILHWLKVPEDKIEVLYLGIPEHLYSDTETGGQEVPQNAGLPKEYILCLSTLEPKKNMPLLIEAFAELVQEGRCGCDLVLAGRKGWKMDGLLENIPEECRKRIVITGHVPEEVLSSLYRHAKVFVFPSFYEGFGLPPLEAMACGCRVISSDAPAMKEVLGDYAVYFKNNQKESLKEVLYGFLSGGTTGRDPSELIEYSRRFSYADSAAHLAKMMQALDYKEQESGI